MATVHTQTFESGSGCAYPNKIVQVLDTDVSIHQAYSTHTRTEDFVASRSWIGWKLAHTTSSDAEGASAPEKHTYRFRLVHVRAHTHTRTHTHTHTHTHTTGACGIMDYCIQ